MLASELASELNVDPSVISKRLTLYFSELGQERQRFLTQDAVEALRTAHRLLETGEAKSFRMAVQMVVGTYSEPVPPESVRMLDQRLARLEDLQQDTLYRVALIVQYLETAMQHQVSDPNLAMPGRVDGEA